MRSGIFALRPAFATTAGAAIAWLCGIALLLASASFAIVLATRAWRDLLSRTVQPLPDQLYRDLLTGAGLVLGSTVVVVTLAFFAAVAAVAPGIGGSSGRRLNAVLRAGPAMPAVAFLVAALAALSILPLSGSSGLHPLAVTMVVLSAFNLPITTERFRFVLRSIPSRWRISAVAAGASPVFALRHVALPRAWPGIFAVALNGAGEMLGESVIVLALTAHVAAPPLAAGVWLALSTPTRLASGTAAGVALIVVLAGALRLAASVVYRRSGTVR